MSAVRLVCLDVADPEAYAKYRSAMEPILVRFGGRFLLDVDVERAHIHPADFEPGRVLLIHFPDAERARAFFADPAYGAARARWFEPAVAQTLAVMLGD